MLLAHGYCDFVPQAGETVRDVADDFSREPMRWRWTGADYEAVAPTLPPDLSNVDNLERTLKALALVMRDYCNALKAGTYTDKTVAQLKTDFATKYNSLP